MRKKASWSRETKDRKLITRYHSECPVQVPVMHLIWLRNMQLRLSKLREVQLIPRYRASAPVQVPAIYLIGLRSLQLHRLIFLTPSFSVY
jgi:hypothetical protein